MYFATFICILSLVIKHFIDKNVPSNLYIVSKYRRIFCDNFYKTDFFTKSRYIFLDVWTRPFRQCEYFIILFFLPPSPSVSLSLSLSLSLSKSLFVCIYSSLFVSIRSVYPCRYVLCLYAFVFLFCLSVCFSWVFSKLCKF